MVKKLRQLNNARVPEASGLVEREVGGLFHGGRSLSSSSGEPRGCSTRVDSSASPRSVGLVVLC